MSQKISTSKPVFDLQNANEVYFDFEVLPQWWCVTFYIVDRHSRAGQWYTFRSDVFTGEQGAGNLYNFILNRIPNHIFIGWNVNYDLTMLKVLMSLLKECSHSGQDFYFDRIATMTKHLYNMSVGFINHPKSSDSFFQHGGLNLPGLISFDMMNYNLQPTSLKAEAAANGLNVQESSISFHATDLTAEQIDELIAYNINDVQVLYQLSMKYYPYFKVRLELVQEFAPDQPQAIKRKNSYFFDKIYGQSGYRKDSPIDYYVSMEDLNKERYAARRESRPVQYLKLKQWYAKYLPTFDLHWVYQDNPIIKEKIDMIYNHPLTSEVVKQQIDKLHDAKFATTAATSHMSNFETLNFKYKGMDVALGLGGLHAAKEAYVSFNKLYMYDATSYYPNLMFNLNLQSHEIPADKKHVLNSIYNQRIEFKRLKDSRNNTYKIVINSAFGVLKAEHSTIFDPINNTMICIMGQLYLLFFSDIVSPYVDTFVQSNTDGVYFELKEGVNMEDLDNAIQQWQELTGINMEAEHANITVQPNVNNYMLGSQQADGSVKFKMKGAWISQMESTIDKHETGEKTYNIWIIGKLITNLIAHQKSYETTFKENPELWKYAISLRLQGGYDRLLEIDSWSKESLEIKAKTVNYNAPQGRIVKNKVLRLLAVQNGKQYLKVKPEKFFKESDTNKKQTYINENVLATHNELKRGGYSVGIKTYYGENFANTPTSAALVLDSLWKQEPEFGTSTPGLFKTASDIDTQLDLQWYINVANRHIEAWKMHEKLAQLIPGYDVLTKQPQYANKY